MGEGGASGEDPCNKAFSARLEEVERCSYFRTNGSVPRVGTQLRLEFDKRPAITTIGGVVVGYLPTRFNYLKGCLGEGRSYSGRVSATGTKPVVFVAVDMVPA